MKQQIRQAVGSSMRCNMSVYCTQSADAEIAVRCSHSRSGQTGQVEVDIDMVRYKQHMLAEVV